MNQPKPLSTSTVMTFANMLIPFILLALTALIAWVNKIDDRQYEQKGIYATKVELNTAVLKLSEVIDKRFDARELHDKERQENLQNWLLRIESQLAVIRSAQSGAN